MMGTDDDFQWRQVFQAIILGIGIFQLGKKAFKNISASSEILDKSTVYDILQVLQTETDCTAQTAIQNHQILNIILVQQGGVCKINSCCTYV